MTDFQGYLGVKAYDGALFQMPALDTDRADQITAATASTQQTNAVDSEFVFVFANDDVRINYGANPTASGDKGSIPIKGGTYLALIKGRGDKIAAIRAATASVDATVDIIPAKEISS